jgi:hypothetical protein
MVMISSQGGHSADVRMRLLLDGASLPLAQLGPDFLLLESSADHAPGEATIVVSIDGNERSWGVRLPEGISARSKRVAIAPAVPTQGTSETAR